MQGKTSEVEKATPLRFHAHLHRGGIGLQEMRRLLEAFAEHGEVERLKQQALRENILGKTSERQVKDLLYAFKLRFLNPANLPPALLVARAMKADLPEAAKVQILFPYFVLGDPLVEACYRQLVLPRLGFLREQLTIEEVIEHLLKLGEDHPELLSWSEPLRLRWSRSFLTLLRCFGLMERHPSNRLKRLWLLPETFAFFWLWFWQQNQSFWEADQQDLWALLQTDARERHRLLTEGQLKGWWHYQRLGDIVQFQPRFASVERWMQDGLA